MRSVRGNINRCLMEDEMDGNKVKYCPICGGITTVHLISGSGGCLIDVYLCNECDAKFNFVLIDETDEEE